MGEADLNLSDYAENEYKVLKLSLRKCDDPNAYVEVALRGTVAHDKTSATKARESTDSKDQLMVLL